MSDDTQDAAQAVVPDQAAEESQNPPQTPEAAEDGQPPDDSKPAREAAKYRHQLRQVEAERDQLTEQLNGAQALVLDIGLRLAGINPKLAEVAGVTAADVLGEDGRPDVDKLRSAKERIEAEFGRQANYKDEYTAGLVQMLPRWPPRPDPSIGRHTPPTDKELAEFDREERRTEAFDVLARDERAYGRQL